MNNLDKKYFFPKVLQVIPSENFEVYAYMNDGSIRLFDVKPLLEKGTVFEPLMNADIFKGKLTVINDTIAWDISGKRNEYDCIDLDPCKLMELPIVDDPLEEK